MTPAAAGTAANGQPRQTTSVRCTAQNRTFTGAARVRAHRLIVTDLLPRLADRDELALRVEVGPDTGLMPAPLRRGTVVGVHTRESVHCS